MAKSMGCATTTSRPSARPTIWQVKVRSDPSGNRIFVVSNVSQFVLVKSARLCHLVGRDNLRWKPRDPAGFKGRENALGRGSRSAFALGLDQPNVDINVEDDPQGARHERRSTTTASS
jgi:hypothetical protein